MLEAKQVGSRVSLCDGPAHKMFYFSFLVPASRLECDDVERDGTQRCGIASC